MNKISRKGFLKIAAAAAMSGVTARCTGCLQRCKLLHRRFRRCSRQLHPRYLHRHC